MSRCTRPTSNAPTVSSSDFNLFVTSEINKISSMINKGQKVLNELERGQTTPKRTCPRVPDRTLPNQRNFLSPKSPECVFSPKPRQSTAQANLKPSALIETMAGHAADLIVDSLIARSNALIPDLTPSTPTPRPGIQRHPAQQADNLMAFEEASPVINAPHSAARRFLNRPLNRTMLHPSSDLYSGTPTPSHGKWVSVGGTRRMFVPEGSSMSRY